MKDIVSYKIYDAPDVNLKNTGKKIKELRLKNHLRVTDIQDFFGFNYPNVIYDWEKGTKLPGISNLIAMASLYEVTVDEILDKNKIV